MRARQLVQEPHRRLRQLAGGGARPAPPRPRLHGNLQQGRSPRGMTCWPLPPISALSPISPRLSLSKQMLWGMVPPLQADAAMKAMEEGRAQGGRAVDVWWQPARGHGRGARGKAMVAWEEGWGEVAEQQPFDGGLLCPERKRTHRDGRGGRAVWRLVVVLRWYGHPAIL
jgi:hypothetical protein